VIIGKLKEPLVIDVGDRQDVYICRGVWVRAEALEVQPDGLSKSAVREVMQKIKKDSECRELLEEIPGDSGCPECIEGE